MPRLTCNQCGRRLKPRAKFCSYCGQPISASPKSSLSTEGITPTTSERSSRTAVSEPQSSVEPIPQVVEASLILRGKLARLLSERDTLEEEMETIRVKQLVGELSEGAAKKRMEKLKTKLERLAREIKEFEGKASTPLEQLEKEHITQAERLQKLETLYQSGEVEQSIYERLVTEYRNKLADLVQKLEAERVKAKRWLSELEARQQQLEFDKETFEVRAKLDELPQSQVTRRLQNIEQELSKISQIVVGLRAVLGLSSPSFIRGASPQPSQASRSSSRPTRRRTCQNCGGTVPPSSKWCYHCGNMIN